MSGFRVHKIIEKNGVGASDNSKKPRKFWIPVQKIFNRVGRRSNKQHLVRKYTVKVMEIVQDLNVKIVQLSVSNLVKCGLICHCICAAFN